jgi:hypothetical protein
MEIFTRKKKKKKKKTNIQFNSEKTHPSLDLLSSPFFFLGGGWRQTDAPSVRVCVMD